MQASYLVRDAQLREVAAIRRMFAQRPLRRQASGIEFHPFAPKRARIARPMPPRPPVTNAVFQLTALLGKYDIRRVTQSAQNL